MTETNQKEKWNENPQNLTIIRKIVENMNRESLDSTLLVIQVLQENGTLIKFPLPEKKYFKPMSDLYLTTRRRKPTFNSYCSEDFREYDIPTKKFNRISSPVFHPRHKIATVSQDYIERMKKTARTEGEIDIIKMLE